LSEGTEVFHNNVRERWRRGDPEVVEAMKIWASFAEEGRQALLAGDHDALDRLVDANFDLRSRIYRISEGNLEMVQTARSVGATSKFAGSGGAVVGTYKDDAMFERLSAAMQRVGVAVVKPKIAAAQIAIAE
jgi:glucuronokinase